MAIKVENYVFNATTRIAPRISVNANTSTTAEIKTAVDAYNTEAANYAATYTTAATRRDYVVSMLEKDACVDVGFSTVDKATNTYTANIKANDYFAQAKGTTMAITTASAVTTIVETLATLKTNLFDDENEPSVSYDGSWDVSKTLPAATYDTKAITVAASNFTDDTAAIFINDVAKNIGTARTFTAYATGGTAKYTLAYDTTATKWQIKSGDTVIKVSDDIDAETIVWADPTAE